MSDAAAVIDLLSHDRPIELVRRFVHGAGGTSLARLDRQPVVVKAWPTTQVRERTLTTGLDNAETMAARSVPIPRMLERGTIGSYSYLLYEFIDGEWPPRVDGGLARQMLAMIDLQRDAGPHANPRWPATLSNLITDGDATIDINPQLLEDHPTGQDILRNAHSALEACNPKHLRATDVVHGDFAPENVLVSKGEITGVVDWEQSLVGDAAFDLAGMIYDIELGTKADSDVLSDLYQAIHTQVPPDAWQVYTGIYAVRYASWAINTEMETQVLDTISRITHTAR